MFFPLPTSGEERKGGKRKGGRIPRIFPPLQPSSSHTGTTTKAPTSNKKQKKAFGVGAVTDVEQNGYKGEKEEEEEG